MKKEKSQQILQKYKKRESTVNKHMPANYFRVTLVANGSFQARGQIGAATASLHHSHGNTRSDSHL